MIRRASSEDLPTLARIEESVQIAPWSQSLLATCLEHPTVMFVAESAGGLCGWGAVRTVLGEAEVLNLAVAYSARRQGWGGRLMHALMAEARAAKADSMFLEVRIGNEAAQSLYQQLGFVACGLRPNYYPAECGREDALLMECSL